MCLFCFQPEIPSLSTFSLHSNLSAYQGLLLKPEELFFFFSCFIREIVRIENFYLLDLVDGCQQLGKGLIFSPESQPYYLHFVQLWCYDGMHRNHMTFQLLSILQALTFFKSLSVVTSQWALLSLSHPTSPFCFFLLSVFLLLRFKSSLFVLDNSLSLEVPFANIFPKFVTCLLILLNLSFWTDGSSPWSQMSYKV